MRAIDVIRALGPVDVRSATRDSMLRWLVVFAPAIGLMYRFGVPLAADLLERRLGFDLVPYYPLIMSTLSVMVAGIVGTIIGFLLLDQRDDDTLTALLVTPMRLNDYLAYRLAVPMVAGVVLTALLLPLAGLTTLTMAQVVATSVCGAPIAPLYALAIGGFANNKVQGFAIAKALGILFPPVIVAWFVPMPWQVLLGIVPLYWPLKVFWLFDTGNAAAGIGFAAIGLAYHALLLRLLSRRLARVVRR